MQYPYLEIDAGVFAPIVKVQIKGEGASWYTFDPFIDTGASFSIFHSEAARILGIDYRKGKLTFLKIGDGRKIPVYEHRLNVKFAEHEFLSTIGFSSKLGVGFNLLGREDFFEKFRVCFNDRDKVLETTFLGD